MKWKKFTLTTTVAAEDLISSMLDEIGIEGIEMRTRCLSRRRRPRGCLSIFSQTLALMTERPE